MKNLAIMLLTGAGLLLVGSNSFAFHVQEKEAIAQAAHEVDEKAAHLHEWAEARSHEGTHLEEAALAKLHIFAEQAHRFHEEVESWRADNDRLRNDFDILLDAWYRVEDTFPSLNADPHVTNDYQRVQECMGLLQGLAAHTQTLNPPATQQPVVRHGEYSRYNGEEEDHSSRRNYTRYDRDDSYRDEDPSPIYSNEEEEETDVTYIY